MAMRTVKTDGPLTVAASAAKAGPGHNAAREVLKDLGQR
jgi:hypothetical protein